MIAYAVYWLIWAELHLYVLHSLGFSWQTSIIDSVVNNLFVALGCYLISIALRWYQPGKRNSLISIGWVVILAAAGTWTTNLTLSELFKGDAVYLAMLDKSGVIRFSISLLIITWIALVRYIYNSMVEKQHSEDKRVDAEKLLREAELTGLRQQLQPHFLFNSLNSISALAGSKPEESRKMIQQLSDFLRGTLKKDDDQLRPLKDELSHLQLYLDIEKVRFGHRLKTEVICDEKSPEMLLPPLLLQPIVENAIKFGLYDTIGEITVRIMAKAKQGNLVVSITNPFDMQTAQPKKGTGFGLSSVQRRLFLIFSRNDLLQLNHADNLFTTTLLIPQKK